jgi:hypothetical protein
MKKVPLLLSAFFAASWLSTSVVADPSAAASGPHTRTEPALECLIGLEPGARTALRAGGCLVEHNLLHRTIHPQRVRQLFRWTA